jgi:DNA (cytosine-5)-methyltransferase 1
MTFGSLFAGIGGFDLGFERAGMTCKWQVEIDPYCQKVLAKYWPNVRRHDDIRTFPPGDADEWRVDVICGGDPCQENSRARIHTNARQPSLGNEFVRVVDALRPPVVVRENPTRVRGDAPWPWWRMRNEFENLGYLVLPFRLRSCCTGAIHQRDRLFLLATLPDADSSGLCNQGRATDAEPPRASQAGDGKRQWVRPDVRAMGGGELLHTSSERLERLDGDRKSVQHAGRAASRNGTERRRDDLPTPRICRSRNEVPNFVDRIRAIGNSVDPIVAEWIGRRLMETQRSANTEGGTEASGLG